jgi:hypothetical protein
MTFGLGGVGVQTSNQTSKGFFICGAINIGYYHREIHMTLQVHFI